MSIIDHIVLFLFLFVLFYFFGKYNYNIKNNIHFWISALLPILFYSLIVGLRYGWGVDWENYKSQYIWAFTVPSDQIGFKWILQSLHSLKVNYIITFVIYAFILVTCALILIRSYKEESKFMYAFFMPATLAFTTNIIRQGFAFSFILLAIYFLNQKRWIGVIISVLLAISIHSVASAVSVLEIGIIYLFFKNPISWKITIPLYIFFTIIFNMSNVSIFADYVEYLTLYLPFENSHFEGYIKYSDYWFGESANNAELYEQGILALVMSSIYYIGFIIIGYKALKLKYNKKIGYIYNSIVLGIVFLRMVWNFEILRRFALPLIMLDFIVLGYIVYVFTIYKKDKIVMTSKDLTIYKVCIFGILSYLLMYWSRFIFLRPQYMFIWNV
jgi:hypothetical protein